jgi:hypothetical protein
MAEPAESELARRHANVVARRGHHWCERAVYDPVPLTVAARGRGLRRTGLTRRDFAREYDDWLGRSSDADLGTDARDSS